MRERIPPWLIGSLVVAAWITGRLLGAATGSQWALVPAAAVVSLGGYVGAARLLPSPVEVEEPGWASSDGRILLIVPMIAWLVVAFALSVASFAVDPLTSQPFWSDRSPHEGLAFAATLSLMPWVFRRQLELFGRRESARRRRRRTEIYDAIHTGRHAGDRPVEDVAIGWRWGKLAAFTGGFAAVAVAIGVFGPTDDTSTLVRVLMWTVLVAWAGLPALSVLLPAVLWPVALRLDGRGIDVLEAGPLPWSAVGSCQVKRLNNVRILVVSGRAGATVPAHLARRLRRPLARKGQVQLSLFFLDTDVAQLALALERFGRRLENPDA